LIDLHQQLDSRIGPRNSILYLGNYPDKEAQQWYAEALFQKLSPFLESNFKSAQ